MFIGISNAVTRGENVWGPLGLFANGEAGASWNVLGYSVIGEAITSITDSSGNDISLANAVTAQQPAYDETEDGIKYAFFDLDDSLSATLPDLGADASKWTITPYAVHIETGQTIGAGSYTAPTNDWGAHGVIDREVTATEINRIVAWAKRNKLTGVDYPTLKTRMDVICMNAVDVFVYDTTKDSDGGAWRTGALAQASSWYNETLNTATRGSRREFPAVAVIVAEASKVTIYDGDDPALPMWRVTNRVGSPDGNLNFFRGTSVLTSTAAANGILIAGIGNSGGQEGLLTFNYVADYIERTDDAGRIQGIPLTKDNSGENLTDLDSLSLVNKAVNDVAMTVLPDAPIDPATGLPVPTIAVATQGGNGTYSTSIITDSGDVYDIASDSTGTAVSVAFDGVSLSVVRSDGTVYVWDDAGDIAADGVSPDATYSASSTPALLGTVSKVAA